jgi:L-fucose mutarotase
MLKGIPRSISPELLKTIHEMGHGDRLLLADAHFPGHSIGRRVLRADGIEIPQLLSDILTLFELDAPANALAMMLVEDPTDADPAIEREYLNVIRRAYPAISAPERIPRARFYDMARETYAVLMTGDVRPYGNLLLTKGVTRS